MQTLSTLQPCSLLVLANPLAFWLQRMVCSGMVSGAGHRVTTSEADKLLMVLILVKGTKLLLEFVD